MVAVLFLSSSSSLFYFDPCRTFSTRCVIYVLKVWNDNQLKSLSEIIIKVIFLMCEVL